MVGIKINSPWVQEMEADAKNTYENTVEALADSGVTLPAWKDLTPDTRDHFFQVEANNASKTMRRNMLDLKALSMSVYSPRWGEIYDSRGASTSFRLVFPRNSGIHVPFKSPVLKKTVLKQVLSGNIYWVKKDDTFDLRLEFVTADYDKIEYVGLDDIVRNPGLRFMYDLLQESAAYMRHFGDEIPYF